MCYIGLEGNGESFTRRREITRLFQNFVKIQGHFNVEKAILCIRIKFVTLFSKINSYVNMKIMTISFSSLQKQKSLRKESNLLCFDTVVHFYDETLKAMWGKTQPLQIKEENDNGKKRARNR